MNVLAIDTVGPVIGVALRVGGDVRLRTDRIARGAETRLVPWAQELCDEAGLSLTQVDGIAVARGPGAFTGIRVGMATAAGLAVGLDRPLWGGISLDSRWQRVRDGADHGVLSLLDARKGRVYASWYGPTVKAGPGDVDPEIALQWTLPGFLATGEGALVYADRIASFGGRVADEADAPAVDVLAAMGEEALARGEGRDPVTVLPLYLRAPDAKKTAAREDKRQR